MNIKPTFFTSDWHLGHEKAIGFDNRPFRNLDEMHSTLITRYNATVPDSGICYFLGDIGNKTEDIRNVVSKLKGTKVLMLGNHDHGMTTMYNCGFDVVLYGGVLYLGKNRISLSHCPLLGVYRETRTNETIAENWHGEHRPKHIMSATRDEGQFHLHGHIHSRKDKPGSKTILGKQFDVGAPAHNYTPVSWSQIESWIMKYGK